MALWRSPPGPATSLWQLVTHATIALYVLMRRRHYYMPAWEGVQVLPGLTIPDLLLVHIVNTRGARVLTGIDIDYTYGSRTCGSIPGRVFTRSRSYCWFGDILQWACIFGDVYMAGPGERFRQSWSCLSWYQRSRCRALPKLEWQWQRERGAIRIGAPNDVRLACQLRSEVDLVVQPPLHPSLAGADCSRFRSWIWRWTSSNDFVCRYSWFCFPRGNAVALRCRFLIKRVVPHSGGRRREIRRILIPILPVTVWWRSVGRTRISNKARER